MSKTSLLLLATALSLSTAGAQDAATPAAPTSPAAAAGAFDLAGSIQRGKGVYMQTCLVCHQATGLGLPGAFPPIAQTDYTTGDARRMVAIVLKGVMGPIKVKDITYNIMLPVDVQFPIMKDDSKVADVVNYVRNAFGNKDEKGVTPEFVTAVRTEFAGRTTQWTEAELLNFPAPAK